jgi:hypothetical protein
MQKSNDIEEWMGDEEGDFRDTRLTVWVKN